MRNIPKCVAKLRGAGLLANEILPCVGSKKWRLLEIEQYTPAPTHRVQEPIESAAKDAWSEAANEAYKALCFQLFEQPSCPLLS